MDKLTLGMDILKNKKMKGKKNNLFQLCVETELTPLSSRREKQEFHQTTFSDRDARQNVQSAIL